MQYDLFDPDLDRRYQAVDIACKNGNRISYTWPKGCWGAANAWLLLVGPSPGKDPKVPTGEAERQSVRPREQAFIGVSQGTIDFKDGSKARNTRWNRFAQSLVGGEKYANALTAVANLDWAHYGSEPGAKQHLQNGCPFVWEVIEMAKPRVVVALTNAVWEAFCPTIQKVAIPEVVVASKLKRQPIAFQIPGYSAPTLFLKAPQHPSWPLKAEYYEWLKDTVAAFRKSTDTQML